LVILGNILGKKLANGMLNLDVCAKFSDAFRGILQGPAHVT